MHVLSALQRQMGMFNGWFGTPWYAALYSDRDVEDASAMALPIMGLGGLKGGQTLLDLGCGRGRHAEVFAQAGLRVTGLDLSETCIEAARVRVPSARFEVFDFRKPYAQGRFDAAICLFNSLGYTGDRADDGAAVSCAAQALRPGGLFVLDLLNGEHARRHLVPREVRTLHGMRFIIEKELAGMELVKRITVEDEGTVHRFEERVHGWALAEAVDLVERADLVLEQCTDEACSAPYDPQRSRRMVLWARKPA